MARPHTSMKSLLKHLKKVDGINVRITGGHHLQVVDDEEAVIVTMPSSPSEYRGLKNVISEMKRAGIDLRNHTYNPPKRED